MNIPFEIDFNFNIIYREIKQCFESLGQDPTCRAIILGGKGKMFTAGTDLTGLMSFAGIVRSEEDVTRIVKKLRPVISDFQDSITAINIVSLKIISI